MRNKKIPNLFKIQKTLGPLEAEVMKEIWCNDNASVGDVTRVLKAKRPVAYTTIMTVMNNLFKKGFLTRRKIGKAYQYQSVAPKDIFVKSALFSIIRELLASYGNLRVSLVAIRLSFSYSRQSRILVALMPKISRYKIPIGYGMSLTLIFTLLLYSALDLFQNLKFFGTIDYINFAFSEPTLIIGRLNLLMSAIFESLPLINLTATLVFLLFFIILGKKLAKLLDIKINIFPRLRELV